MLSFISIVILSHSFPLLLYEHALIILISCILYLERLRAEHEKQFLKHGR